MQQVLSTRYRVNLFGGVRLTTADGTPLRIQRQHSEFLLGYLVTYPNRQHLREHLIAILWPNQGLEAGRDNLSTNLSALRRILEPSQELSGQVLQATRLHIQLSSELLSSDIAEFESRRYLARTTPIATRKIELLEETLKLYTGEFMQGCYHDWAIKLQDRYREQHSDVLTELTLILEEQGQWTRALSIAEQALLADPYRDEPVRTLMRGHARSGRTARAIEIYRQFQERLLAQFNTAPAPTTNQLAEQIQMTGQTTVASNAPVHPNPISTKSIPLKQTGVKQASVKQTMPIFIDGRDTHLIRDTPLIRDASLIKEEGRDNRPDDLSSEPVLAIVHARTPSSAPSTEEPIHKPDPRTTRRLNIPNNLTRPLTPLIGRDGQLANIHRLLGTSRLFTLTGIGGVGKSRIALQLGLQCLEEFPDGIWLVDLSDITPLSQKIDQQNDRINLEPINLEQRPQRGPHPNRQTFATHQSIVQKMYLQMQPHSADLPSLEQIAAIISGKQMLMILDNGEHLVEPCRDIILSLLQRCPHLKVLFTSRENLGILGEQVYPLDPLALPEAHANYTPEQLLRFDSVALFYDTAIHTLPTFMITPENVAPIVDICRYVNGIPFALILAASRVDSLSVKDIDQHLKQNALSANSRSVLPSHQTIQAMLDRSFALLSDQERTLLINLSLFRAGFSLHAAEAIIAREGRFAPDLYSISEGFFQTITSLAAKSLIERSTQDQQTRYSLLEITRQYGLRQLQQTGHLTRFQEWHARYYASLANSISGNPIYTNTNTQNSTHTDISISAQNDHETWIKRQTEWPIIESEYANLMDGLAWLFAPNRTPDDQVRGFRLAGDLTWFWILRSRMSEGHPYLMQAKENLSALPTRRDQLHLLLGFADLEFARCEFETANSLYREALTSSQTDPLLTRERLRALQGKGNIALWKGRPEKARELFAECLALATRHTDQYGIAQAHANLGILAFWHGETIVASQICQQSSNLFEKIGDLRGTGQMLYYMGRICLAEENTLAAQSLFYESEMLLRKTGDIQGIAQVRGGLCRVALAEYEASGERASLTLIQGILRENFALFHHPAYIKQENMGGLIESLHLFAALAAFKEEWTESASALGTAAMLIHHTGIILPYPEQRWGDALRNRIQNALGEATYLKANAQGRFRRWNPLIAQIIKRLAE